MSTEFETLITRASEGDRPALEALIEANLPGLRAFVRLKAGPGVLAHESVSDLAQSVCREVLEHLDRFQYGGPEGFRRWLYTRALRKIGDRHRYHHADKRDVDREVGGGDAWRDACRAFSSPSQHAIAAESHARLEAAFAWLSPEQQNVVLWSRFVGMSHAEIAKELGKSQEAVRQILSRALSTLAEQIDEEA